MTLLVLNNQAQSFVNNADHHQTALKYVDITPYSSVKQVLSCLLPWMAEPFQNGIYSYKNLFLEEKMKRKATENCRFVCFP